MSSNALIGISGVHYVVSELSRRGMIALPTIRNTSAYDIIVVNSDGTKHANIQVKTSMKRVTFFPMPTIEKIRTGKVDFYILVRWLERETRFEGFMLKGREAKEAVSTILKSQKRSIDKNTRKGFFSSIHITPNINNKRRVNMWSKRWREWRL